MAKRGEQEQPETNDEQAREQPSVDAANEAPAEQASEQASEYVPKIVDPPAEPVVEEQPRVEQEPTPDLPERVTLLYTGFADLYEAGPNGEFKIRPGQPVTVPREVALDLLTTPNEPFEIVEEQEAT